MQVDTRSIQLREMEIVKEVCALCERHGLRYFADSGTCLGAVRHHGFIPWDDDVDISMPRVDFEKFRRIAKEELPEYFQLMEFEQVLHMPHLFLKVQDTRTAYIGCYYRDFPDAYTGVFVDIFPIDGCPDKKLARMWWSFRIWLLQRLNWALRTYKSSGTPAQKALGCVAWALRHIFPYNWASQRMEKILRRYPMESCANAKTIGFAPVFPSACFRTKAMLPFEDIELPCPGDYDTYLTCLYGDYMQPPPEEERKATHDTVYWSLEHSYRELIDENGQSKLAEMQ